MDGMNLQGFVDVGRLVPTLVPEIVQGAALVVLGYLARTSVNTVKTILLQRRHRVGGRYVMKYSRPSGEASRRVRLSCKLRLRGRHFRGRGTYYDEVWLLEGKLDKWGNLIGSYSPDVRFVRATGTFCLEPTSGHHWTGWWSGMSRETEGIEGGPLELVRVLRPKIRSPRNVRELASVQSLRDGIPSTQLIRQDVQATPDNILCAIMGKQVIGFALCSVLGERLDSLVRSELPSSVRTAAREARLGALWEVSVAEGYRDRTVGTRLIRASMTNLTRLGCTSMVTFHPTGQEPSILLDLGFLSAGPVEREEGSEKGEYLMFFRATTTPRRLSVPGIGRKVRRSGTQH